MILGTIYSAFSFCSSKICDYISFGVLGLFSASVFNGNMAFIAVGFPQQYYGRLLGLSEIFSTIAGLVLLPLGKSVIGNEWWEFYHICLLSGVLLIGTLHVLSIFFSIHNPFFIKLDRHRKNALNM